MYQGEAGGQEIWVLLYGNEKGGGGERRMYRKLHQDNLVMNKRLKVMTTASSRK